MPPVRLALVYIAGPFRGKTPFDVKANVHEAEVLGLEVAALGGFPIIPHSLTQHFDKQLTDEFWLEGHKELLRRCDAIVMSPRWPQSTGATAELREADRIGLPSFFRAQDNWDNEFGEWLTRWTLKHQ